MAASVPSTRPAEPARQFLEALGSGAAGPLASIRAAGRERFAESGFPTKRHEAWRFTELKPLIEARFEQGSADLTALDLYLAEGLGGTAPVDRLVFVDGRLDESRSAIGKLPDGVFVGSFARWAAAHDAEARALFDLRGGGERAFLSLNAAYFADGLVVTVPDGVALERTIHAVYWNEAAPAHVKSLVRLGQGASATLVETFAGTGRGWTNLAATVELSTEARLRCYTLQDQAADSFHTAHLAATIGERAYLNAFLLTLGARLARQDAALSLAGTHAFCGYSGAYLLEGRQEAAVSSVIEHAATHGRTHEVFKGCVDDRAHGIFQGKILVAPNAQKTDGYQLNKTILLSERAVMDAKPELEICADDVKCSHGATVGDLDETALFYLRSRGIPPEAARQMLIEAFLIDAVELIEDEVARDYFARAVAHRLVRKEG